MKSTNVQPHNGLNTRGLVLVWNAASVSISTRPQHRASKIPENLQTTLTNVPLRTFIRRRFCGGKCPRKMKLVPHWKMAYCLSSPSNFFGVFTISVISSCLFSINQSPANSQIPGCFPAVQEVRSPHRSQQTRVHFLWRNQTQLDPATGCSWELVAVCICFRRQGKSFYYY